MLVLHMVGGKVVRSCPLPRTPARAKPILAAALKSAGPGRVS
jgi:hypothetical protein